jgi:ketosteroid isomerase-like protein
MSQENVEVVRGVFEAWNAGDMDAIRNACDPEIIMRGPKAWPEPGPFFGQEAVMRAIEQLRDTFESDWQELNSDLVHVGDRVAVRTVWHGLGHGPELKQESTPVLRCATGGSSTSRSSGTTRMPSKPCGCRSRTLPPIPEPAGYCAAMSQEIERFWKLLNRREIAWVEMMAPDVEWHVDSEVPLRAPTRSCPNPRPLPRASPLRSVPVPNHDDFRWFELSRSCNKEAHHE